MSIAALTAAIQQLSTDVAALIAQGATSVPQSDVDAATASVTALDATVQAALAPVATVAVAAVSSPVAAPAAVPATVAAPTVPDMIMPGLPRT